MKSNIPPLGICSMSPEKTSFTSSIASKATPLTLKSWVTLSMTLDGRDKITKIFQYTSRLLGYYFEVCSSSAMLKMNENSYQSDDAMKWMEKARRFRNIQKALTQSRKAYRFGRTLVEVQKLREMGIFYWLVVYLRQFISRDSLISCDYEECSNEQYLKLQREKKNNSSQDHDNTTSEVQRLDRKRNSEGSRIGCSALENYREGQNDGSNHALHSPSRNENIGCKLSNTTFPQEPPTWKTILGALKLVGLASFWAGDNVSYLYGTGFWVDEKMNDVNPTSDRRQIMQSLGKKAAVVTGTGEKAAIFATRSYFFASLIGLYLNTREWINSRNGLLRAAIEHATESEMRKSLSTNKTDKNEKQVEDRLDTLRGLEEAKRKHFVLCLSLLKSICDVIVFSNNSGVDLQKKYLGRKMNEGIQCVCGITSALTVLYNKFPNAETINA